jgi:hypothetical protein
MRPVGGGGGGWLVVVVGHVRRVTRAEGGVGGGLAAGDDADARGNVPFPYFRAQGLHTLNKRVNNV